MSRIFEAYRRAGRNLQSESSRAADSFALERFPGESAGRVSAPEPVPVANDEVASRPAPDRPPQRADVGDHVPPWRRRDDDIVAAKPGPLAQAEFPGVAAQCRRLVARLNVPHADVSRRKILVTSVDRSACTGSVAVSLAAALAEQGDRTLLIDSGQGTPLLHEVLDVPNVSGLGEMLRDQHRVQALQLRPQLHLLTVGSRPPSAEELRSGSMREVLARGAGAYDWLIISGATAEADGVTRSLAALADHSILVVGGTTPFTAVDHASSLLGGRLYGTVIVGLPVPD